MKTALRIGFALVAVLALALVVRFALLGQRSREGQAPGLVSGALSPCAATPNCVCSECANDAEQRVAPLDFPAASAEKAWSAIARIIGEQGGEVAHVDGEYLAATFTSAVFGFVDDLECRLDARGKQIQIRSASRVGHSDFGVNRKRVEALTQAFDRAMRDGSREGV